MTIYVQHIDYIVIGYLTVHLKIILSRFRPIKVFANTIYSLGSTNKLYYTLKYLDSDTGSGKIIINFDFLRLLLNLSSSRLWRLLKKAKDQGLLRGYKVDKKSHQLSCYLSSHYRVVKSLGKEKLGTIVKTDRVWSDRELKKEVIEATSYERQFNAREKVMRQFKGKHKKFIRDLSLDRLWEQETSNLDYFANLNRSSLKNYNKSGNAKVIERKFHDPICLITDNKIFMGSTGIAYGTNQTAIAQTVNCSISTIYRHQYGIEKKQVCLYHRDFVKIKDSFDNQHGYLGVGQYGDLEVRINKKAIAKSDSNFLIKIPTPLAKKGDRSLTTGFNPDRLFQPLGSDRFFYAHTNFYLESTYRYNLDGCPTARKAYQKMVSENLSRIPKLIKKSARSTTTGRRHESERVV